MFSISSMSFAIEVNMQDSFSYQVDQKSLLKNQEMDLSSFIVEKEHRKDSFLKRFDINNLFDLPDSLIVVSKYAAILKNKRPNHFNWSLVTSELFHESVYKDQTAHKLGDNLIALFKIVQGCAELFQVELRASL